MAKQQDAVLIAVRLPKSQLDEIDRVASADDRSRSQMIRRLLALGLHHWRDGAPVRN